MESLSTDYSLSLSYAKMIKPPLSLYCHVPWCVHKCPYCDFNSFQKTATDDPSNYTDALCKDIAHSARHSDSRALESVFIGGGTPSLFPEECIDRILDTIRLHYKLTQGCEITLEMNPSSFEREKMKAWKSSGINRLSIGVQSFNDDSLYALGRTHSGCDAHDSIEAAINTGFKQVNIDIMYGLPQQSKEMALDDLQRAIHYQTNHLSWYELTIEPGTKFANNPPHRPSEDIMSDIDELGQELIKASQLERYEISAYAKPQHQCKHNKNYWTFGDYIGCGNGASTKLTTRQGIQRFQKYRNPALYQQAPTHRCVEHFVDRSQQLFEFMLNHLRLYEPISLQRIQDHTELTHEEITSQCRTAITSKLMRRNEQWLNVTKQGYRYLNDLQAIFLNAEQTPT
ncbi:MAG: YggW family oxidoreductase [Legionellales bacterium]|nr:YggW family oxidoreductase [Legionellales bacterium]